MTDLIFQSGLSNACFAIAFAVVAMALGKALNRPALTHLLWLLVFVRLLVPPTVHLSWEDPASTETLTSIEATNLSAAQEAAPPESATVDWGEKATIAVAFGKRWLGPVWLLGALVGIFWTLVHVIRFNRLVASESRPADPEIRSAAARICAQLGLSESPRICVTKARLTPMVWWAGGSPRVVLPAAMLEEMKPEEWECVLAHELAHVKRRDHVVRWLECLVCILFWWHPVVWWAQKNLRAAEEVCCDALVLSRFDPKPSVYAESILAAVDSLALSALRPPAMASEINSGGTLEERIKMIISSNTEKRKRSIRPIVQIAAFAAAVVCLPFGVALPDASAADRKVDYAAIEKRLRAAIGAGELTQEQAQAMMAALKRSGKSYVRESRDRDVEVNRSRVREEPSENAYRSRAREEYGEDVFRNRIQRERDENVFRSRARGLRDKDTYRVRAGEKHDGDAIRDRVQRERDENVFRSRTREKYGEDAFHNRIPEKHDENAFRSRTREVRDKDAYPDRDRSERDERAYVDRYLEMRKNDAYRNRDRTERDEKAYVERYLEMRKNDAYRNRDRTERDEKAYTDRYLEMRKEGAHRDRSGYERNEGSFLDRARKESLEKARLKHIQAEREDKARLKDARLKSIEKARRDSTEEKSKAKRDGEKQPH